MNTDFTITKKHKHTEKRGIYAIPKPVKRYKEVKDIVEKMIVWLNDNNGKFEDPYKTAYAVSHNQVELDNPRNFFIVAQDFVNTLDLDYTKKQNKKNYYFPAQAIFNPEILETPEKVERDVPKREIKLDDDGNSKAVVTVTKGEVSNRIAVPEACMSFMHRSKRDTERFYRIKVKYQYKGIFGLRTKTEWIEGIKAHIFQHEYQHSQGENMYFNNDNK